jgi:hypothetical protein
VIESISIEERRECWCVMSDIREWEAKGFEGSLSKSRRGKSCPMFLRQRQVQEGAMFIGLRGVW